MLGRTIRFFSESISKKNKQRFISRFNANWLNEVSKNVDFKVVSFSGGKQFEDQVYSIASFIKNVGKPFSWIIYNDGSYNSIQVGFLEKIQNVQVQNIDLINSALPIKILEKQPTLKKVEILIKHQNDKNTIFTDSDILFYRNFSTLFKIDSDRNYYLVDEGNGYFDEDFMNEYPKIDSPFNFGLIFSNSEIDMSSVVSYILEKIEAKKLGYWSDQTAFQKLVMQDENFCPLGKELFKVGGSDAFKISHCVDYNKIALRHFVGPVRHKMWQYPWKKVLGI